MVMGSVGAVSSPKPVNSYMLHMCFHSFLCLMFGLCHTSHNSHLATRFYVGNIIKRLVFIIITKMYFFRAI